MKTIYLDAAATSKPHPEVVKAMMPYFDTYWHNPSSLYAAGVKVKDDIDTAKKAVADFINADNNEIYFTSSGSEGNSWAIQGFINYCYNNMKKPIIITTTIEHKSILYCLENNDIAMKRYVPVDSDGFIDIEELESLLDYYSKLPQCDILVSVQFANNEVGTIQNIEEIGRIIHKHNAILHSDAVQAFGQIPIDVKKLGIDMLTVSGHKIGCPKGIGFLYKSNSVDIKPLIYGGQMRGMRGGTENVPYIIGMAKAVDLANDKINHYPDMIARRDYFIGELEKIGCTLNGSATQRLPNNINVMLPYELSGESLLYLLDMCDIQIGVGSACNNDSILPSPVLSAMGKRKDAHRAIRITFSYGLTKDDIDYVVNEIRKQIELLGKE